MNIQVFVNSRVATGRRQHDEAWPATVETKSMVPLDNNDGSGRYERDVMNVCERVAFGRGRCVSSVYQ